MAEFEGRLRYLGWLAPWIVISDAGVETEDFFPTIAETLAKLDGVRATMRHERDEFTLSADPGSEFKLLWDPGALPILSKIEGFGFTNVGAYLEFALQAFNGQRVRVTVEPESFRIAPIDNSGEHGVWFTRDNSCGLTDEEARRVCKPGTEDACVFLSMGSDGWACQKFNSPTARLLLNRVSARTIRARRIGSCRILGRKETTF